MRSAVHIEFIDSKSLVNTDNRKLFQIKYVTDNIKIVGYTIY